MPGPLRLMFLLLLVVPALQAAPLQFESPSRRATLLELYTSEGCSSCPPADRWISGLRDDPRLWRDLVPVAFHVDYWDHIGWPDRFAAPAFSRRQREYAGSGRIGSVYTPGFVVDGDEWRGWFRGDEPAVGSGPEVGVLALEVDVGRIRARYRPRGEAARPGALELHVALLGFGLETEVRAGENAGRTLRHDFVVLDYRHTPFEAVDGLYRAGMTWRPESGRAARYAVAGWVAPRRGMAPLQAVGGWLPEGPGGG